MAYALQMIYFILYIQLPNHNSYQYFLSVKCWQGWIFQSVPVNTSSQADIPISLHNLMELGFVKSFFIYVCPGLSKEMHHSPNPEEIAKEHTLHSKVLIIFA